MPPPFDEMWFLLALGFVIGVIFGSFITMLSYRLPMRYSIIKPGSFCPKCMTLLLARDLIPIISWLSTNGRCRYCRAEIHVRYPLIELASGVSCAAAFGIFGFSLWLIPVIAAIVMAITGLTIALEREG